MDFYKQKIDNIAKMQVIGLSSIAMARKKINDIQIEHMILLYKSFIIWER
jgi:hypothetical protein